jgi:ApbE superfamily uncharacterized protein (UPF0280 family)
MNTRMQVQLLPDGRRLHLHDGPIDLIIETFGEMHQIDAAYRAAVRRFATVLDELCSELSFLRRPYDAGGTQPDGAVAQRMAAAVAPPQNLVALTSTMAVISQSTLSPASNLLLAWWKGQIALRYLDQQS